MSIIRSTHVKEYKSTMPHMTSKRSWRQLALILSAACAFAGGPVQAAACRGVVTKVIVAPEGDFYADFGYGRLRICHIDGNVTVNRGSSQGGEATITAARCQALYAGFLSAKYSSQSITIYVDQADCVFVDGAYPNPYPYQIHFAQ
ncbi:hypothetical protein [Novosphingobium sp.]|uniref:hypothetical protein n=1 Tax=Novosphingobium sp. TaxID=1874826 RepID=UPI002FE15B5C